MEQGDEYADALAEAQRLGFAEPDPTEDVNGADAAAKMAILATVAFGSRTTPDDVEFDGIERVTQDHVRAARELKMTVRLVGSATLVDGKIDVRVQPSLVDRHHPLAAVEGPFNAVMLQGDAIREITLEGPGAGGLETASAVVADMISVVGTKGTGFLQNDACWRTLERLPRGELRSPFYLRVEVADQPGVLAQIAHRLAEYEVSIARLVQHQREGGATLHLVTHEAPAGAVEAALSEIAALPETQSPPSALPVISSRGVTGVGWT
jgi:homoserine dehydrogenase